MRTHWKALTYEPKILAVRTGKCTQTIRPNWKIEVGDKIGFHGWEEKPYRSKWSWRTKPWEVIALENFKAYEDKFITYSLKSKHMNTEDIVVDWSWDYSYVNDIAKQDHINPPTGIALRDVLKSFYGELNGQEMQIIRWNPKKVIE